MCNQMVTSEIRERLRKLLGFGQNATIPFDYPLISWVTNCVSNVYLGFLTCLSWIVSIENSLKSLDLKFGL